MVYGAKKGQQQPRQPHIAKDDLVSTSYFKGLYGLAEGEILGLADGGKSIFLDGTPLINANGQPNFKGVTWDFRSGTLDQEHIAGFSAVENERNVGVELRHDRPFVQAINNTSLSAVRLRLNFNALREQKTNGDIVGYAIQYAIDVQTDSGAFTQVLSNTVRGKASQGFKKSHRIDLPKATKNWTIRVRRITPNRDSDLIADTVSIDAITEIIDAKLRYPATAMLGLTYDATTFSNIAKLAVRLKGKLIQVPTNYDPVARTYSGLWDGTFKLAYSNNPAWVLYDICTHKRYGLGERLAGMVDKWRLYQIGQYCDELVDDGKGGKEPRFAINVYIQQDDDAYKAIQNIASVFRGLSYWDGTQIVVDSDTPKDPVYTFSPANIVGGEFSYTGTRARDRHTVVKAAWDNPDNDYNTEYELIRDEQGIAKYGIRMLDISVFGCTSQAQAQRAGLWALKSEQLETRTVSFKTGLQGFIPQVGQIINIADNVFAGRAISGRVVSHNAQTVTLDRMAGKVGDSIVIGKETAKITRVDGQVITTDKALTINDDAVWAVISDDLKLMQFRILTIAQNDDATFSITALQYERQKYDAIDYGAQITPAPITALKATPIQAPASVTISQSIRTHQNQSVTTMTINWTQVQGAVAYQVRWRKDDGNWQNVPKMGGQSVDIDGVYSGNYIAEVQAIDAFDNESLATSSTLTAITGKVGKPPRLARLTATGKLFGMDLAWSFNAGSGDTNYTEIQVSPDGVSNIATLGTFAYPTDKHTINGLQGNLTQFYRARIVDKLGNVSDWTAWASGKTEAQADKVLNLLQGQITASQLHQDLSTPIGKIGGIESGLNTAKIDLSALNASMTTAKSDIDKAKADIANARTDLNTATSNINTERNRISAAIADITALQSANNAKTQEIANLTQTVGGHTSSIRDLAVTTGDLSQKYSQLKTASDTANSEITAIKQTQAGQATQINTLGSRFDSLSVGGRNLLRDSGTSRTGSYGFSYPFTDAPKNNDDVVITIWGYLPDGKNWGVYNSVGTSGFGSADKISDGVWQKKVKWREVSTNYALALYQMPNNGDNSGRIDRIKLERGNIATDWTPAPEGIDAQFVQTNANISTLQQTVTSADNALSQRIDALDANYKSADSTINASLTAEQKARADADTALSSRITAIDTAYKSADTSTNAKLAALEQSVSDKDGAMAQRVDTLNANYTILDSRTKWTELTTTDLNTLTETGKYFIRSTANPNAPFTQFAYVVVEKARNDRITQTAWADSNASLVYTRVYTGAWRDWEKTATGKELDTKATTASLDEFKQASANADNALSQRITALDTAYKSADSALSSRVTTAEQSITTANQAIAQTQQTLNSRFDGLAVGGRNLLRDSVKVGTWSNFVRSSMMQTSETGFRTPVMRITCIQDSWYGRKSAQSTNNLQSGESYVLSFFVKSNSSINNTFVYGDNDVRQRLITSNSVVGENWQLIKVVFTASNNISNVGVIIGGHGTANQSYIDIAEVKLEKGTVATDWTPAPEDIDAQFVQTNANISSIQQTLTNADNALSSRIDSLNTTLGTKASAAALDSLSTQVNQVDSKLTAEASKVSTLQTTVGEQTASIQQHSQSINGLSAQWTLKAESNGIVSGIGLASSNGVSDFAVRANKFYVVPPTGTTKQPLFSVLTTATTVGGVSVPAGVYLSSAYIQNGSIANAHIANGAITTAKIGDAQIDNAKIANGAISTAKIGIAQVDTLQIAGDAVVVPRAQSNNGIRMLYDFNVEVEIHRLTLNAQGGVVLLGFGFVRLFSLPNGAYTLYPFYPKVGSTDLKTFLAGAVNEPNSGNSPVVFLIRRNGTEIKRFSFEVNYTKDSGDDIVLYNQWTMPEFLDTPPTGGSTYTITIYVRSQRALYNNDRYSARETRLIGTTFSAMAVKR